MNKVELTDSYQDFLLERLRDPVQAAAYLNAALEDEHEGTFLLALRDVTAAQRLTPPQPETQWADVAGLLRALNLRLALR
ncbi:MAG: DNA-binding protein [Blastocatellia bacterium]